MDDKMIYGICGKHWNAPITKIDAMITASADLKKELDKVNSTISWIHDKTFNSGDDEMQ